MLFKLIQSMPPVLVQFCVTRLLAFTTQTGKNLYNLFRCLHESVHMSVFSVYKFTGHKRNTIDFHVSQSRRFVLGIK